MDKLPYVLTLRKTWKLRGEKRFRVTSRVSFDNFEIFKFVNKIESFNIFQLAFKNEKTLEYSARLHQKYELDLEQYVLNFLQQSSLNILVNNHFETVAFLSLKCEDHLKMTCYSFVIFIVSLLALGLSIYTVHVDYEAYNDEHYRALCDINEKISCTKVFTSKYGTGFGLEFLPEALKQPNGMYGAIFYTLSALISMLSFKNDRTLSHKFLYYRLHKNSVHSESSSVLIGNFHWSVALPRIRSYLHSKWLLCRMHHDLYSKHYQHGFHLQEAQSGRKREIWKAVVNHLKVLSWKQAFFLKKAKPMIGYMIN